MNIKELPPTAPRNLGQEYKDAFVTFIDILGFKNLVANKTATELNQVLGAFGIFSSQPQRRRSPYSDEKHLPIVSQFSDSIVRIQPVDNADDEIRILDFFHSEITTLLLTQGNLACNGVLIRGAMTYGRICVHNNRIFGPAFNEAYRIESSLARYPRIVIDEILCSNGNENPLIAQAGQSRWNAASSVIFDYLLRSDDGLWMVNYLPHMCETDEEKKNKTIEVLVAHRDKLSISLTNLKDVKNSEPVAKIRWAANYHNQIVKKHFPRLFDEYEEKDDSLLVYFD
jgi:hypothetical protein